MRRYYLILQCILWIMGVGVSTPSFAATNECQGEWAQYSPFTDPTLLDTHAIYWRYRVELPTDRDIELKITGQFPHARYTSFSVYDQANLDVISTLPDFAMTPEVGSQNPYQPNIPREVENRAYTVHAIQGPSKNTTPNFLQLPQAKVGEEPKAIELWYRIFLPDDKGSKETGGVSLPKITPLDAKTGESVQCPKAKLVDFELSKAVKNLPPPPTSEGMVHFYALRGSAMYANANNRYLGSVFHFMGESELAILRFRPPSYLKTQKGQGSFTGNEEVRYFSFCLGGTGTKTSGCIADEEMQLDADGLMTLIIGPEELRAELKAAGRNFLSKKKLWIAFLIYRTFLPNPNFKGNTGTVPYWPPPDLETQENAENDMAADKFIGDYAPIAKQCSIENFHKDFCGVKVVPNH